MLKKLILNLSIVLICAVASFAQNIYTPEKSSTERAAILNVLRVPIERDLKQKIQFSIDHFNVQGNWAFLDGVPQNSVGGAPDYGKTEYKDALENGFFDNNFFALLKKTGGKWRVIKYQIGCTDVCYLLWSKDYKAPKAIFPNVE